MNQFELRNKFLDFFNEKGHEIVPSSSLLPADPTSLFTSAGMQQFVPYLSGETDPPYLRACSAQKCLRVGDIEEVGDDTHHTFFEMLGNWSFGDYFKEKAIDLSLEFLVDGCNIPKEKLWVSIFKGENGVPRDDESDQLWQKAGVPKQKIYEFGMKDNFWGPVSKTGPCGPCSEIHYDQGKEFGCGKPDCGPNCCERFIEIWNLVFMEYNKKADASLEKLPKQNVDTGLGFERFVSILQKKSSNFTTDLFFPIIQELEKVSGLKYQENKKSFHVLADHLRTVCFVVPEGIIPSNVDRGYILRMLLRRSFRHAKTLGFPENWYKSIVEKVLEIYTSQYPEINKQDEILEIIQKEEQKFGKTLKKGLKEFEKLVSKKQDKIISGEQVFNLYQSFGFPLELTKELAQEKGLEINEQDFQKAFESHKQASKKGAEKKFGGVGIGEGDTEEEIEKKTRLHTATHLMHQALRTVLGDHVQQMGSDITLERLRFDFSHSEKLTDDQVEKVENIVNEKIKQGLNIEKQEMEYEKALESGALAFFKEKYPKSVFVYIIGDEQVFSKEVCAGPHVKNTSELGEFKIQKQESAGAGIRRIKAILK